MSRPFATSFLGPAIAVVDRFCGRWRSIGDRQDRADVSLRVDAEQTIRPKWRLLKPTWNEPVVGCGLWQADAMARGGGVA